MLRNFYPSCRVKNVFQIDYEELYENGYRGILFDIDNTLVHHGDDSTEVIDNLFQRIHQTGLKTVMLSNNSEDRIKRFIRNIDTLYVADAGKPNISGYLKAVELFIYKNRNVYVWEIRYLQTYMAQTNVE